MTDSIESLNETKYLASKFEVPMEAEDEAAASRTEALTERQASLDRKARIAQFVGEAFMPTVDEIEQEAKEQAVLGLSHATKKWQVEYPYTFANYSPEYRDRQLEKIKKYSALTDELEAHFSELGYEVNATSDLSNSRRGESDGFPRIDSFAVHTTSLIVSWPEQAQEV